MESLLILLAIVGLEALASWFKKRSQKRNGKPLEYPQESLPEEHSEWEGEEEDFPEDGPYEEEEDSFEGETPQPLQDLIRKFHEEQAKLSGDSPREDAPPDPFSPGVHSEKQEAQIPERESFGKAEGFGEEPVAEEKPWLAEPALLHRESVSAAGKSASLPKTSLSVSKKRPAFSFNRREAAKGFLWAKVLDDPRFKRRSPFPITGNPR